MIWYSYGVQTARVKYWGTFRGLQSTEVKYWGGFSGVPLGMVYWGAFKGYIYQEWFIGVHALDEVLACVQGSTYTRDGLLGCMNWGQSFGVHSQGYSHQR